MPGPADRLAGQRVDVLARIEALRRDVSAIVDSASSTTGDDEHDPEGATIGFERAQAIALLRRAEQDLDAVDAALARVADGSYGLCVVCGGEISAARLDARPEAARCIACAR